MGRHDFRNLRVCDAAGLLMKTKKDTKRPPWFQAMTDYPPSPALTRPSMRAESDPTATVERARQRSLPPPKLLKKYKKPSKMFMPVPVNYAEDDLRNDFFGDHPWELARPRVILENDGRDYQRLDWSRRTQDTRPLDGECVIQRQMYLMNRNPEPLSKAAAYDQARKEFYQQRLYDEIEARVAREEALSTGAEFGKSTMDVGMQLENETFDKFRTWAKEQVTLMEQARNAAYTGAGSTATPGESDQGQSEKVMEALEELGESTSTSNEEDDEADKDEQAPP